MIKRFVLLFLLISCLVFGSFAETASSNDGISQHPGSDSLNPKLDWWKNAKFGLFLHWGLYSKTAGYWKGVKAKGAEHFMLYERIPLKEYAKIADDFNPVKYYAADWVLAAKQAGMKYIVITTKHHDGFAMFNSPSNDYNIQKRTPFGKDPMKELANACHKHGMKLGFYYSLGRDWQDPDVPTNWPTKGGRSNTWDYPDEDAKVFSKYFDRKVKPQIRELLTQYGQVDLLWFDTPELISQAESEELRSLVLSLQPNCIINSRIGHNQGDYSVSEQEITKEINPNPWESCITMSRHWGYISYDSLYKSPELMVRQLLEIVSKGGNLLLDTGPTSQGELTKEAIIRMKAIGEWMKFNSEGIYGSKPWKIAVETGEEKPKKQNDTVTETAGNMKDAVNDATSKLIFPEIRFTSKGDDLYAYVCNWKDTHLVIKFLSSGNVGAIQKVTMLGSSRKIQWVQTKEGLNIEMPDYFVKEIAVTGFKIRFTKKEP
jgi:alpha-L-fucosidase